MNKNFFDEGIEQSWCQFLKRGVFLNQLHKAVNVNGLICLLGDLFRKLLDSPFQTFFALLRNRLTTLQNVHPSTVLLSYLHKGVG